MVMPFAMVMAAAVAEGQRSVQEKFGMCFFDGQKYNFSIKDDQLSVPLPELRRRHPFLSLEELTKG